jgi:predicted nucleic acid-binding protein
MPLHFLDTSALAKRYLPEVGSTWVDALCTGEPIAVSTIASIELASAFARHTREGRITTGQRDELMQAFLVDRSDMLVQRLTSPIIQLAMTILLTYPRSIALRSLDAIQLASARNIFNLAEQEDIEIGLLISADARLLAAAEWAGFATDNPENHP